MQICVFKNTILMIKLRFYQTLKYFLKSYVLKIAIFKSHILKLQNPTDLNKYLKELKYYVILAEDQGYICFIM
jgi:hypothetical protein